MFLLFFSLFLVHGIDIKAARDSVVQQILDARWRSAIEYAKSVLTSKPNDDLLLGLIQFGKRKTMISTLTPQFMFLINERESSIAAAWEDFYKENNQDEDILEVLATLYLYVNTEKTRIYASKMLRIESLRSFAYFLLGYASTRDETYNDAINYYRKSLVLDTTSFDCLSSLAQLYLLDEDYDSALIYYRKIPIGDSVFNSVHVGEIMCHLGKKNYEEAKKICGRLQNLDVSVTARADIESIEKYLQSLAANNLSEADTALIIMPCIFKDVDLHRNKLLAILTDDGLEVIDAKSTLAESSVVPYYDLETFPVLMNLPKPTYPVAERKAGIQGRVVVKALVDIDGNVMQVEILESSGNDMLDKEALITAKKARFKPAKQYGKPVRVWVSIPMQFKLTGF